MVERRTCTCRERRTCTSAGAVVDTGTKEHLGQVTEPGCGPVWPGWSELARWTAWVKGGSGPRRSARAEPRDTVRNHWPEWSDVLD